MIQLKQIVIGVVGNGYQSPSPEIVGMTGAYLLAAELVKYWFYASRFASS